MELPENVWDVEDLRERTSVFADREQAGTVLAGLLEDRVDDPLILAIPAGGVPVAIPVAERLGLELDLAAVSKITLPWNTESGFGAIAFDGTILLNEPMLERIDLTDEQIDEGIARTRRKVARRADELREGRDDLDLDGRSVVLVDDGLASGFTMKTAMVAARNSGATDVLAAVPTGHKNAVERIALDADGVACANVRSDIRFAVAAAYKRWHDVSEDELSELLGETDAW
jgi:predicted phosphoribosyltransferase